MNAESDDQVGLQIYQGSASVGRFLTLVFLIVTIIIAIIFIIYGVMTILQKNRHTEKVQGTIVSASCNAHHCYNVTVSYPVPGATKASVTFDKLKTSASAPLKVGDPITLYYNKNIHSDASTESSSKYLGEGIGMIVAAVLVVGFLGFFYWLVKKYEPVAAIAAPFEIVGILA